MFLLNLLKKFILKKDRNCSISEPKTISTNTVKTLSYDPTFSLQGTYTYDEIVQLTDLVFTYKTIYGYCDEIGPVAIINAPESDFDIIFLNDVWEYGKFCPEVYFTFKKYASKDEAKNVTNYKVFGRAYYLEDFSHFVKFEKFFYVGDSRHIIKCMPDYRVFNMDYMLDGQYSYEDAKALINSRDFRMSAYDIIFAIVDESIHVCIMGIWNSVESMVAGFRDVWEYGKPEPKIQKIRFLSYNEAKDIDDFKLYGYDYILPESLKCHFTMAKVDRSLDPRFDFYDTIDGRDYRMIPQTYLLRSKEAM